MPKQAFPPALSTTWPQVLTLRLQRHGLATRTSADDLVDAVARMLRLHAQVMSSAELQAAARIDGLRPADVRDALWEGRSLVKVWAFRQTLHLLTADDLPEFVVAARSLERWHTPVWLRYFKLTEREVERKRRIALRRSSIDRWLFRWRRRSADRRSRARYHRL